MRHTCERSTDRTGPGASVVDDVAAFTLPDEEPDGAIVATRDDSANLLAAQRLGLETDAAVIVGTSLLERFQGKLDVVE